MNRIIQDGEFSVADGLPVAILKLGLDRKKMYFVRDMVTYKKSAVVLNRIES